MLLPRMSFVSHKTPSRHNGILTGSLFAQLPFWLLVAFGAFLLARLGWGVLTFNDVPEAHAELMKEITEAKTELRGMGVSVD
jgi:dolichyl-phosphate mannosyltransferase polypeptide 3